MFFFVQSIYGCVTLCDVPWPVYVIEGACKARNRKTAQNRQNPRNCKKFRPKPKTEIKALTDKKALVGFRISLSEI